MNFQWESTDKGHRATLRSKFATAAFRIKEAADGVSFVLGKMQPEDKTLKVQSVVFDKDNFDSLQDAKAWLDDNSAECEKEFTEKSGRQLDAKHIKQIGGVNKRVLAVHAAPGEDGGSVAAVTPPDESQLELINQYTRSPKTADQVAIFPVLACNDVIDRDVDQFTTDCVKGFINLEGPLSPLGKSFMVGHNYSNLPVGRIFDGEAMTAGGITWLKLWTYIPNTDQYQAYLENVDYGVYWAVSVGVMLNSATCSIGDEHEWGWYGYACSQNHVKGERYDADGGEADAYGYPLPVDNGDLCYRRLFDPSDFYELSQVYLGAQYMAEYDKGLKKTASAGMKQQFQGVKAKTASDLFSKAHVLSIKAEEAASIPTPKFPIGTRISQWTDKGNKVEEQSDGTYRFTSEDGLVYTFDPADGEELCLGQAADAKDPEDSSEETEIKGDPEQVKQLVEAQRVLELAKEKESDEASDLILALEATLSSAIAAIEDEDSTTASAMLTAASTLMSNLVEMLGISVTEESGDDDSGAGDEPTLDNLTQDEPDEEEAVDKAAVLQAAKSAGLQENLLDHVEKATGNGLEPLLKAAHETITGLQKQVSDSASKAALGEAYIKDLRAQTIHWYTLSQRDPDNDRGVNTDKIERLLTMCGDNADLIKEQLDLYRDLARRKFPEAVRRSSFPTDPNERHEIEGSDTNSPGTSSVDVRGVKRIHG